MRMTDGEGNKVIMTDAMMMLMMTGVTVTKRHYENITTFF